MKNVLFLAFMGFILSLGGGTTVSARTFNIERTASYPKRAQELKDIVLAIEETCDSGCKYKAPGVREMKIVETIDPDHFYSWVYIDNIKDSSNFNYVEVEDKGPLGFVIRSSFAPREKVREFQNLYDLYQNTAFDDLVLTWKIKEHFDSNQKFLHSTVTYSAVAKTNSPLLRLFAGTVEQGLQDSADHMMINFNL